MAKQTSRRLVALSTSAIATIYAAGFLLTRSADASLSGSTNGTTLPPVVTGTIFRTTSSGQTAVVGASTSVSAGSASATTASTLKDGTYAGQGTSRRGGVSVSVTIQGGVISNVQITGVSTQYPVSRIASLPGLVVKQQSANVNTISGATYSSQAFNQAIQQALTSAQSSTTVTG